jgi:hypothetical protein
MLLQMSDPLLAPLLGTWRLDPLSMEVVKKILPERAARHSVDAAMEQARLAGCEDVFSRFLSRCENDRIVIGARSLTFHHYGKPPFSLPIQEVTKEGRKTLVHCVQKPPYPVEPVVYCFHFYKNRLVMSERMRRRKPIVHRFYLDK